MEGENNGACMILLLYPAISDIKYRKFYIWPVIGCASLMTLYRMITGVNSLISVMTGVIPGILLIFLSKWSKGKIGEGDGWIVIALGALLGWYEVVTVFSLACGLSAGYSLWLIAVKKRGKETGFAFVPFLLMAVVLLSVFREQVG